MRIPLSALLVLVPMGAFVAPPPLPAPPAGPGGVITALKAFAQALDDGNASAVGNLIAETSPGADVAFDGDGKSGEMHDVQGQPLTFFDVTADGAQVEARSKKDAVGKLLDAVASNAQRRLHTKLLRIRADCPSSNCSYGVVEFERTCEQGGKTVTVPMRATALVTYDKDAEHHFRLFHWHASPAGPAAPAVAASRAK